MIVRLNVTFMAYAIWYILEAKALNNRVTTRAAEMFARNGQLGIGVTTHVYSASWRRLLGEASNPSLGNADGKNGFPSVFLKAVLLDFLDEFDRNVLQTIDQQRSKNEKKALSNGSILSQKRSAKKEKGSDDVMGHLRNTIQSDINGIILQISEICY